MVSKPNLRDKVVCIVGLGYVGLPLAEAFSKYFRVIGFDINKDKICKLRKENKHFELTTEPTHIKKADFIIISVPTPADQYKEPDMSYIKHASEIVGQNLKKNSIVVLESTVYPGVTEEIVVPILERESGFILGRDFKIGYSPERINPGDTIHTIDNMTKVISGMDEETTNTLVELYGKITNLYKTKDIRTAEASKVIENIQRDLNIALMNEFSIIFNKMGLDTKAVLDAASTKWNFIHYKPGLVGGHCIPVDPYYLVHKAKELDYHPQVILAGRSINDYMSKYVAELAIKGLNNVEKIIRKSKVLIMGLSYKENVPDTREAPAEGIVKELEEFGVELYGYDPLLDTKEIQEFNVKPLESLDKPTKKFDAVIITVIHDAFKAITLKKLKDIMNRNPVIIDVRRIFDKKEAENEGFYYITL